MMMHFRERVVIIDEKQSKKRQEKYTNWRQAGKRQKHYRKFPKIQKKGVK
jgi:hypothetical protein